MKIGNCCQIDNSLLGNVDKVTFELELICNESEKQTNYLEFSYSDMLNGENFLIQWQV